MSNPLPYDPDNKVVCGKTLVDWENAVVYVLNKEHPEDPPTHLHFTFSPDQNVDPSESCRCIAQWTRLGSAPKHRYSPPQHEFYRARRMALQVLRTFRRKHLQQHGMPPDQLGLGSGFTQAALRAATEAKNRSIADGRVGQLSLRL